MSSIQITPTSVEAPLIEFDIVNVGKFQLPVLGAPGVPFGIMNAFGIFQSATTSEQKMASWSMLMQSLADSYPAAVRVMSRLGQEDVGAVFKAWGEQSGEYNPKA